MGDESGGWRLQWLMYSGSTPTSVVVPDAVVDGVLTVLRPALSLDPYRDQRISLSQLGEIGAALSEGLLARRELLRTRTVARTGQAGWRDWMGPALEREVEEDPLHGSLSELLMLVELAQVEGVDLRVLGR